MSKPREIGKVAAIVGDALARASLWCFKRPLPVLVVTALMTAVALFGAKNLRLDADLVGLLPKTFPSVKNIERLKERFGAIGYVAVVGEGATEADLRRFADTLAPKIEALDSIRYVDYRRPGDFFDDHALYYLETEELEDLYMQVKARADFEKGRANPLFVDLEDNGPPKIDISHLEEKYGLKGGDDYVTARPGGEYHLDPKKGVVALLAKPAGLDSDLGYAKRVVEEVQAVVDSVDTSTFGADFHVMMAGGYTKKVDQQKMIEGDLGTATFLALFLVFFYLALHFRRLGAVGLIMVPLLVGVVWSFGVAGYAIGTLNILTGFIGAILVGMGIDHGIHLLGRYEAERAEGHDSETSLRRTYEDTGRAAVVAAATTTVAFLGLSISEFRAFREFGIIAGVAMVLLMASYTVVFPACLGVAERLGWSPRSVTHGGRSRFARWAEGNRVALLVFTAVFLVVSAIGLPQWEFDFNFRNLVSSNMPSFKLDHTIDGLLGHSQTPIVVLTQEAKDERAVAAALRKRKKEAGKDSTIHRVAAGAELVPPAQDEKQEILEDLEKILDQIDVDELEPSDARRAKMLLEKSRAEPFVYSDLPVEIRRQFAGPKSDEPGGFVLVYPAVDLSDGSNAHRFAGDVKGLPLEGGKSIDAAGGPMVMADIFDMVQREAPPALLITLGLVFVVSFILLGSLRVTLLALLPAFLTMVGTLGLLTFTSIRVNYLNIVMIPVLFGLGVDGGAHMVTRLASGARLSDVLDETGRAIAGAVLTTSLGFSALTLADHRGLTTFGLFALFGLAVNLIACLVMLPAFVRRGAPS